MPAGLAVAVALAASGASLVAGAFWVFSAMVIPGLRRAGAPTAVAAMQAINIVALRPPFLTVFLGTAAASAIAAGWAAVVPSAATPWIAAGAACYLLGGIAVTRAANVPLNDALAAADADSAAAGREAWLRFRSRWSGWNNVRAVCALAAAALFVVGLL